MSGELKSLDSRSFWSRKFIYGTTIAGAVVFFIAGIIFWGGFNTAMEATNTLTFCIGCHEMEENVYKEYKPTIHYSNRTGVRAGCPQCHVPDPWVHKVVRKVQASNELLHKAMGTVDTPEKFNDNRLRLAKNVWAAMKKTDSRECRNCHNLESMNPEFQRPRARSQHMNAITTGQTCIDCHKGIAHKDVRHLLTDEEIEKLEAPNPDFIREVPEVFKQGLARVQEKEAKAEADAKLAKEAEKAAEQARIDEAVASALADSGVKKAARSAPKAAEGSAGVAPAAKPSAGAAPAAGSAVNVDWSKAASRQITLFYPGQTSIEWIQNGRDHGGARPFTKGGDRCVTCHDAETADMGKKMVSGQKAETSPIPGKRGSIPVQVDATFDSDYLYLRFTWPDTSHVPVPFVDGGKMDPANPMKLAVMFASDKVEFADRAGCWATCHHDARNMPDAPAADLLASSEFASVLDLSAGVTKYLGESRTAVEIKESPRGGWNKLKPADAVKAEMSAGKYMDLVRYKSGKGQVENGHILAERTMSGGQGVTFDAKLKGGNWSVVMKRKLKSGGAGDISMEKGQVYNFGFAIHDDYTNSRFHHVSLGYRLGLDNVEADINAKAQ